MSLIIIIVGVILGILSYLLLFKNSEKRTILTEEDANYLFSLDSMKMSKNEQYNESDLEHKVLPALYFELQGIPGAIEINTNCDCNVDIDDSDILSGSICNCIEFPTLRSGSGQLKLIATFPSGTKRVQLKAVPQRSYLTGLSDIVPRQSQTIATLIINYNVANIGGGTGEGSQETNIQLYLNDNDEPSVTLPLIVDV